MFAGAILGLVGSMLPEIVRYFRMKQEHKQELEILKFQLEYQKQLSELRLEEAKTLASIELDKAVYEYAKPQEVPKFRSTGSRFLDVLQGISNFLLALANVLIVTVRPVLTYVVIGGWLSVKYAMWKTMGGTVEVLPKIWTDFDNEFVSCIIVFWFGQRAFLRARGK